tara:strand:+ start:10929 stop:11621 length:693 start_codon:yes stop_codon:yes gene_type:complete
MGMGKIINVILSSNPIYLMTLKSLSKRTNHEWIYVENKDDFNLQILKEKKINRIFVPHWSYKIPESIYNKYEVILFHMTDLPFGRGGSPLQNLIKLGYNKTKVSAIRVTDGIDEGPIYLKRSLSLNGSAEQIFNRTSSIITNMIIKINENKLIPKPQLGKPVYFKRRIPDQSRISDLNSIKEIYDHIRMLDCEGYPKAFLEFERYRFEFENVRLENEENLVAKVNIKLLS